MVPFRSSPVTIDVNLNELEIVVSVKYLDNSAFYGYRVRRTVDGKLHQEYFSLKANGKRLTGEARKRVERAAMRRDRALAQEQAEAKQANKAQRCFNPNGSVRGISYLVKTEKSGTRTPIFQVGIASEKDGKIICTSYSINAHGKAAAWAMAVATFAQHKAIAKNTKLYKDLLAAMPKRAASGATTSKVKRKAAKKKAAKSNKTVAKKKAATKKAPKKKTAKKAAKKVAKKAAKKVAKKKAAKKKAAKKTSVSKKASKKPAKKKKLKSKAAKKKSVKNKTTKKRR